MDKCRTFISCHGYDEEEHVSAGVYAMIEYVNPFKPSESDFNDSFTAIAAKLVKSKGPDQEIPVEAGDLVVFMSGCMEIKRKAEADLELLKQLEADSLRLEVIGRYDKVDFDYTDTADMRRVIDEFIRDHDEEKR